MLALNGLSGCSRLFCSDVRSQHTVANLNCALEFSYLLTDIVTQKLLEITKQGAMLCKSYKSQLPVVKPGLHVNKRTLAKHLHKCFSVLFHT